MNRFASQPEQGRLDTGLKATTLAVLGLLAAMAAPVAAQTPPASGDGAAQRVEITGSIIRRVVDDSPLPVTSISAVELEARGHTELKEFMLELPQANSLGTNAGTAGPMTSLRGFGPMRTLTLLDGRRLAKESLVNQYVSVSVIPRMALERTDILRDGASSSYGSDAIGGVQAFYTRKSFEGLKIKLEALQPERSGGADEQSIGLMAGRGNLQKDGWNVYAALEVQQRAALMRKDRPELTDVATLTAMGVPSLNNGTTLGTNATPGNFTVVGGGSVRYNPYYATGCGAYADPSVSGTGSNISRTCFADNENNYRPFGNDNDITTLFARGSLMLGGHKISASVNHGFYRVGQYNDPIPVTVRLTSTHPYYPGNGIVPAVAGLALNGRAIDVLWSVVDTGPRIREDEHTNTRLVLEAEGQVMGWDYRTGLNVGRAERATYFGSGWTSVSGLATVQGTATTLFLDPKLNPFGLQTAEGLALLKSRSLEGRLYRLHKTVNDSIDFTLTRELGELPGGPIALAVGGEFRRDGWEAIGFAANDPQTSLNGLIDVLGGDSAVAGARASSSNSRSRNISSLFTEVDLPVLKSVTVNAAVRADKYADLGETTVNPKLSLRWQPMDTLTLRASANTGFRAPSLPEIYTKETERTELATFNDPLYCANGTPTGGYTAAQVCNLSPAGARLYQITKVPGNSGVQPETSKAFTFGLAFQPTKGLGINIDYWQTQIDDVIGTRNILFMLANPTLYQQYFRRNADGTLASDAVINTPSNVGSIRARGLDVSLKFVAPKMDIGQLTAGIDIAYLLKWDARSEDVNGNQWISALGQYNDVVPVNPNAGISNNTRGLNNRWRHTAMIGWALGDWSAQLSQRYQSRIRDQNATATLARAGAAPARDVAAYEQWNAALNYKGIKNLKLGLAVNNLFDKNPPQTNHGGYQGYLTSVADVVGRAYRVSAEYQF
ncbi:MAG: TonB-dependent receptor [Burkholderiaceae bacterium]|nr:TonB-dependent receptor [Burkholderiaceae bacterium]